MNSWIVECRYGALLQFLWLVLRSFCALFVNCLEIFSLLCFLLVNLSRVFIFPSLSLFSYLSWSMHNSDFSFVLWGVVLCTYFIFIYFAFLLFDILFFFYILFLFYFITILFLSYFFSLHFLLTFCPFWIVLFCGLSTNLSTSDSPEFLTGDQISHLILSVHKSLSGTYQNLKHCRRPQSQQLSIFQI